MSGVAAIVQARMGSTRLPGKVMMDVLGRPLLARVIERAQAIPGVERVILATTADPRDQPLIALAGARGIAAFAGSEDDVLDRYYQAARQFEVEVVVRITADCPLLDPGVSGAVLARFLRGDVDYASNTHPPTFPDGLDTEVFSFAALARAWRDASLPSEREHVTAYLWKNPDRFRLANVSNNADLSAERWTVDEAQDLEFVRAIYAALGQPVFGMADVLHVLEQHPELRELNSALKRNAGYARSLKADAVADERERSV